MDNTAENGNPLYVAKVNDLNEQAIKAWYESSRKDFSVWYDCSDTFARALREGGYDMPHHFIYTPEAVWNDVNKVTNNSSTTPTRNNSPAGVVDYLLGKTPAYAAENTGLFDLGSNIYATPSFMSANFGGVSLSKTASLLADLSEIKGAFYDDKTGQVILMGKQNLSLPQMKLDDLSVAVNSVYSGQDPGVSIDPPLVDNQFSVRYEGRTTGTEFGWIMFEADRVMKTLSMGKDNITGAGVTSSVTGYKNMLDRYKESNQFPADNWTNRFWFRPKEMKLVKSPDGNSFVFDTATMECLTESKFKDNVYSDPQAEAFAQNLTQYYNDYAKERPIFKDLERLGRITSIVKWIRDNDIPIDLSFIRNYQVPGYATPANTPATQVSTQWQDGNIIRTLTITGGVTYTKPNEYLSDTYNVADPLKQAALSQRPAETNFKWNFTSNQNEALTAVAESFSRLRKDGNLTFSALDLSYPADCDFPLAFIRYYDSFYDKASGFGLGWEYRPYQIRFPENKQNFTFGVSNLILSLYPQVFVIDRLSGQEDAYTLLGIDGSNLPLYAKEGQASLLRETPDTTLVLNKTDNTRSVFDNQGNLISTVDKNNKAITYTYQAGKLTSIDAGPAGAINISYSGNLINAVSGPGPRTINYTFDLIGNLVGVTNAESQTVGYAYDPDRRINKITDSRNNVIFEGTYDDYNRLTAQKINQELDFGSAFILAKRQTTQTDPNLNNSVKLYDDKYRVIETTGHTGNKTNIVYTLDYGPGIITDAKGADTKYTYDAHGNVASITTPDGAKAKLYYDSKDNLIASRDPRGFDTAYGYDANNRLEKIYHSALLNFDVSGNFTGWQYDPNNLTTFTYDTLTGHLLSITNPEGLKQIFANYNASGLAQIIKSASGFALTNAYDSLSRLKSINDPGGNSISFAYTNSDRIKSITTAAGTSRFDYDANNNLISVTDANINVTAFSYDAKNNLLNVTDPELGITSYGYNKFNNLSRVTLPNNTQFAYEYEDLNRLVLAKSGVGAPVSVIAVLEDNLNLGSAVLGNSITKALTVYNIGTKELTITNASCDNNVFSISNSGVIIPRGEGFIYNITFTPFVEGGVAGLLTINSDDPSSPIITVNLSGQATLPSISPSASSSSTGVQVNWQQYANPDARFNRYAVYRSTSTISDISGLTPITTISNIAATSYTDTRAVIGTNYYYTVVALDVNANKLTAVESYGPVAYLNLGRIGQPVSIDSSRKELSASIVYNSTQKEYLAVYEYDFSGAGNNYDIYGQRISAEGSKIGEPFPVLDTIYSEHKPQVSYNSVNNEYLVVCEADVSGNNSRYHAIGQRMSIAGSKIGSWFYILETTTEERNPRVAYNAFQNRYFIVMEYNQNGDGTRWNILRCLFSGDGSLIQYGDIAGADSNTQLHNPVVCYNSARNEYLVAFEIAKILENYNLIYGWRIDADNNALGTSLAIASLTYKSYYPRLSYNPDRNEYACAWQYNYNGDGKTYGVRVRRILGDGTPYISRTYTVTGQNLLNPDIAFFSGRNEYLFTATNNFNTSEFNVLAQRISASTLGLLTTKTIVVAGSTRQEKNNCVVFNPDKEEFLAGYEYDVNTDGLNYDIKAQRIGRLRVILSVNPAALDFGSVDTGKLLEINNSGEAPMNLRITSDQPWLTPGQLSVYTTNPAYNYNAYVSRTGLSPGNYSGNIHIDYASGAIDVPVKMAVSAQPPGIPSSPVPADGAKNQADLNSELTVTLGWQCSDPDTGDSLSYDLYFSDDYNKVNNQDISCRVLSEQPQTSYKSSVLQYLRTYYWRVAAKDSYGLSTVGPVWSFSTPGIASPQIIAYWPDPTNNKKPALSWNSVFGASKYHLQISAGADFSSLLVNTADLTGPSYTLTFELPEAKIYWRVAAIDSLGNESVFSAADDFTVQAQPAANTPPVAGDDTASVTVNNSALINVLANDTDADGTINAGSVLIVTQPVSGRALVNPDGAITYTPALDFTGAVTFTYIVQDNQAALSNVATVTVNVAPVNIAPVVNDDTATTNAFTPVTIDVLANDTDESGINPASITIVTQPLSGTAVVNSNGTITYTPNADFSGADTFTYTAQDTLGAGSNVATVSVNVLPETIKVTTALFRRIGARWIISGTDSVTIPVTTITVRLERTDEVIGTPAVSQLGIWSITIRLSTIIPQIGDTISVISSRGAVLRNVPITIRD